MLNLTLIRLVALVLSKTTMTMAEAVARVALSAVMKNRAFVPVAFCLQALIAQL